jgi:penicillin-binding protein 1C
MLADNSARAASFGLNSYLAHDFPVACKTGTSSDYRDNWAVGYTPEFTVAVWIGNPDGSPMRAITGVSGAAPVLHAVFTDLRKQRGTSWFNAPESVEQHRIHPLTGRLAAADRAGAVTEKCLWKPEADRPGDFDAEGRAVLPPEYAHWLRSPQNSLGSLAVAAASAEELRIVTPRPGSIYFLDPDLPSSTQNLRLTANGAEAVRWSSPSLWCDFARAQLIAGTHTITAEDPLTGRRAETWIEVRPL